MKLKIYFDALCPLCSREINHYKKRDLNNAIEFIDITSPEFHAEAEGLNQKSLEQFFHVRDSDGKVYVGVDGFIKIWETLPGFGWLATIGKNSFLKPILIFGYRFFAKIRPYLPRLKRDDICETGICDRKEII